MLGNRQRHGQHAVAERARRFTPPGAYPRQLIDSIAVVRDAGLANLRAPQRINSADRICTVCTVKPRAKSTRHHLHQRAHIALARVRKPLLLALAYQLAVAVRR